MARGRAATYDDQRGLILQRAAELFAKSGYAATSMNQVAEACGFSKPTLYHYFRDKDALLASICDEHVLRLHAMAHEVLATPSPTTRSDFQTALHKRIHISMYVLMYEANTTCTYQ